MAGQTVPVDVPEHVQRAHDLAARAVKAHAKAVALAAVADAEIARLDVKALALLAKMRGVKLSREDRSKESMVAAMSTGIVQPPADPPPPDTGS